MPLEIHITFDINLLLTGITVRCQVVGQKPPGTRGTVMTELSEVKLAWGEAQRAVQNKAKWTGIVVALCPTGDEKDKVSQSVSQ